MKGKKKFSILLMCILAISMIFAVGCGGKPKEEISEKVYSMKVGESYKMTRKYEESVWSTSDETKIVISAGGVITALAEGDANVIETASKNKVIYRFKIAKSDGLDPDEGAHEIEISLNKTNFTMLEKSSTTIEASVFIDGVESTKVVAWSIKSGEDKLTLTNANTNEVTVKGIKTGSAVVMATYENKTAECNIGVLNENYKELAKVEVVENAGRNVTWAEVPNALSYETSEDNGTTWVKNEARLYDFSTKEEGQTYELLIKAVGDGVIWGDSTTSQKIRTKLHLEIDGNILTYIADSESQSYALYDGETLICEDVANETPLNELVNSGDYKFSIKTNGGKTSNILDYQTGAINRNEINSFDSVKEMDKMTASKGEANIPMSYANNIKRGEKGNSLKIQTTRDYNIYTLRSLNDISKVTEISFYIFIDSTSFKNGEGAGVKKEDLPKLVKAPFIRDNAGCQFDLNLDSEYEWQYDTWLKINGTIKNGSTVRDNEINIMASSNPADWGFAPGRGVAYFYTFYVDDVYVPIKSDIKVVDDKLEFDAQPTMTYDLYKNDTNELIATNITSGYSLKNIYSETGNYKMTLKTKLGEIVNNTEIFTYSTGYINEKEINSFNSRKEYEKITAKEPTHIPVSFSNLIKRGESGSSLKVETTTTYNYFRINTLNDLKSVTNISFYIYIDGSSFKNKGLAPVAEGDLPTLYKNPFIRDHVCGFTLSIAEGETLGYNKWVKVTGVAKAPITITTTYIELCASSNKNDWGGVYVNDSAEYFYTYYIDDVYAI